MNTLEPMYCISAQRSECTHAVNERRHEELKGQLKNLDLPSFEVIGKFEGVTERSYCVVTNHQCSILTLARRFNQDCILLVDANRECHLIDADSGASEHVGSWRVAHVGKDEPAGDWTRHGDIYYHVVPR